MDDPKSKRRRRSRRGGRRRSQTGVADAQRGQGRPAGVRATHSARRRSNQTQAPPGVTAGRSVPRDQLPANFVYGLNPVGVALELGMLKVMYYDQGRPSERTQQLHAMAHTAGVEIRPLARQGWSKVLSAELHQGVAGMLLDAPQQYLEEIVLNVGEDSCVLVLDRIQDPQNLGAVLRTAAACGVDAVVLPKAGGCPVTPAVHKASAGMSLKVRIVEDENLSQALDFLKDHGYWVVGCDSAEGEDATTFEYPEKRVIVMGNEAEGMRHLVREHCDYLVRLPMDAGVDSLNVSVATAVVLYLARADLARAAWEENNGPQAETPLDNQD